MRVQKTNVSESKGSSRILLAVRSAIGGALMGMANLVPGISGGTMLLAAGIYADFVKAIAEVTTFRFRRVSAIVLGSVLVAAALAILLGAGPVKDLVVNHRWIMYSLFIGLTLGGVPLVWRMVGKSSRSMWIGLAAGFLVMWAMAVLPLTGLSSHPGKSNIAMLFVAGLAGASAMILPGISGGYLLLLLGQYVPILSAIDRFKGALENGDIPAAMQVGLFEGLPVAAGVLLGVVCVSNLLRLLFERYRTATLGVLLGLLLGSVIGLWPFQQGVRPEAGDFFKGQVLTAEVLEELNPEDYPTRFFHPGLVQIGGSILILLAGFGVTTMISRIGRDKV